MKVLSCVYNETQYLIMSAIQYSTTIKSSTEVNYFDLPHLCLLSNGSRKKERGETQRMCKTINFN